MFKWSCLGVAVVALLGLAWALNDIRVEIKRATRRVNEDLPEILAKARTSSDAVSSNLPDILERTRRSADTLAELSDDVRQLKDLAGMSATARDKGLVAYADSVLDLIESSGGRIGVKKFRSKALNE